MVRTRSGKATTAKEEEDKVGNKMTSPKSKPKASKKTKTPKGNKSNSDAAAAAHVSFERDVKDQPGKTYIKSPTAKSLKKVFSFRMSGDGKGTTLTLKLRESPFFFTVSIVAMLLLSFTAVTVWAQLGVASPTLFQFLILVLCIHQLDIVANVCNELLDGNSNSDAAFFFTEAAMNVSEVMLFSYSVHPDGTPSFVGIAFVVGAMFPACWMNVRFRDEDQVWVRALAYVVLTGYLVFNGMTIIGDKRLFCYASFVAYAMIADLFDLPDKYTSNSYCDGMVMVLRSFGCYLLVTYTMLKSGGSDVTVHEMQMMKMLGF